MEIYSSTTRFALACNQSEKVPSPGTHVVNFPAHRPAARAVVTRICASGVLTADGPSSTDHRAYSEPLRHRSLHETIRAGGASLIICGVGTPRRRLRASVCRRPLFIRDSPLPGQVLERLMRVIEAESVPYVPGGLEAIVFTADGDMRRAAAASP